MAVPPCVEAAMEVCESGGEQPLLQWDRKLSELCEPADPDTLLCHTVRSGRGGAGREGAGWLRRPPWAAAFRGGRTGRPRPHLGAGVGARRVLARRRRLSGGYRPAGPGPPPPRGSEVPPGTGLEPSPGPAASLRGQPSLRPAGAPASPPALAASTGAPSRVVGCVLFSKLLQSQTLRTPSRFPGCPSAGRKR